MSKSNSSQKRQATSNSGELGAAIVELCAAVAAPIDRNNLGRLAQMHTWFLTVAENAGPDRPAAGAVARAATALLEALILGETANADAALDLLAPAAGAVEALSSGETVDVAALLERIASAAGAEHQVVCATTWNPSPDNLPLPPKPETTPPAGAAAPFAGPAANAEVSAPETPGENEYQSEPLTVDLTEKEHLVGFIEESREHMDAIEAALLEVEHDPTDTGKINELFRPFHTIKGIAGFLNLRDINRLTHEVETILDLGRKGERALTRTTIDLVFAAIDVLKLQIDELQNYLAAPGGPIVPQPDIRGIMRKLRNAVSDKCAAESRQLSAAPMPAPMGEAPPLLAENAPAGGEPARAVNDQSIRVDTAKLDALVDAVGELVIAQTMVNLNTAVTSNEKLHRDISQVTKIVRDVQETAMAMRMVPIGHTFQKMRRLVRDVAQKAEKLVELKITGEETELDKNVIQAISDPLVHMVRNAVDHGIESPSARIAAGKCETGSVHLHACHEGDSVVVSIRDDGRGLDRDKLIAKAIERGLVQPGESLSDQQVFALIFAPGFSTAEKVTDISGRGVGMDVVRRNIEQLRGKVEISSELGTGSLFKIRLPLTLAIIDGMIVRIGAERIIIPTILIEQSLRPEEREVSTVQHRGQMIRVRGELLPLVQLGPLFDISEPLDPCNSLVVVVQSADRRVGVIVDELIGQQQVVIKTLGERFKHVRGVSGAAILGDGRVGLILEPAGLLSLHMMRQVGAYVRPSVNPADPAISAACNPEELPSLADAQSLGAAVSV